MKVLTATTEDQGGRAGDFTYAVDGELVLLEDVCARDRRDPDGGCGCGRALAGLNSHRATTTAQVHDLDLTWDGFALAVSGCYRTGGAGPELLGADDFAVLVSDQTQGVSRFAQAFPVGTVLGRRPDSVFPRFVPSAR